MCGVVGVLVYGDGAGEVDREEVVAIRDAMTSRGPDGSGAWYSPDGRVALAHRRLAIIGLGEQGHQPMELAERCHGGGGPLAVSFNGEIYNYRELRRSLADRGHRFAGDTDTEVLLHLYEEEGSSLVHSLRGMFAFALWDAGDAALVLARDPFGIKPLYLADDGGTLRVASQARALLAGGSVPGTTSEAALAGLLVLGSVPEPHTAWEAIEALPAGTALTVRAGGGRTTERYFSLPGALAAAEDEPGDDRDPDPAVRSAAVDSVRAHLVADVEVGVFLSAGIDSGSILGLAAEGGQAMSALTLGFDEFAGSPEDEVPLASAVAGRYGAQHTVGRVTRADFTGWLPTMLADMDQPSVDGLNTWMVARQAATSGLKVALSGIGGDEFLGGYPSFLSVPRWVQRLRGPAAVPGLGRDLRAALAPVLRTRSPKAAGLLEYGDSLAHGWLLRRGVLMPWELADVLGRERANSALAALDLDAVLDAASAGGPRSPVGAIAALEGGLYLRNQLLRDADWAGMAHSLEIRVPLVDGPLLAATAGPLTRRWTPPEGKQSLARAPSPPLPASVTARPKTGFSVPMHHWATDLAGFDAWRRVPVLAHPRCSWARRWAYSVADAFAMV